MDYCQLLFKAQENKLNASSKEVRCYNTSFEAPKKLEKKVSSENIKRFLARKEEEEKRKLLEAKKKKDELLALRSQDRKAQKRVQVMLKRTKSANKSVMEDAIDHVNTADTLAGPAQCDEDDYGYVSNEASAYYKKLMDKYQKMPLDTTFSATKSEVKDLKAAKDRVKAALLKEAEEEMLPHKRKRKKKNGEEMNGDLDSTAEAAEQDEENEQEISKPTPEPPKKQKKMMPPPLDFTQILKIAEKKQFEPIIIEKAEIEKEPERLMTKKEKIEYLKEKERRAQKGLGPPEGRIFTGSKKPDSFDKSKNSLSAVKKVSPETKMKNETNDHKNDALDKSKTKSMQIENSLKNPGKNVGTGNETVEQKLKKSAQVWSKPCNLSNQLPGTVGMKKIANKNPSDVDKKLNRNNLTSDLTKSEKKIKHSANDTQRIKPPPKNSEPLENSLQIDELSEIDREIELLRRKRELLANRAALAAAKPKPKEELKSSPLAPKPKEALNKPLEKHRVTKPLEVKSKATMKNLKPKQFPPPDLKKKKIKKPNRLDSDSEYDSEMDDFIDDGPDEAADISRHIRDIFGYDKSRYRDVDDDECLESNFAQQMKEEFVSTKIGIMEDLEDIRKEQLEKARKKKKLEIVKSRR